MGEGIVPELSCVVLLWLVVSQVVALEALVVLVTQQVGSQVVEFESRPGPAHLVDEVLRRVYHMCDLLARLATFVLAGHQQLPIRGTNACHL